MRSSSALIAAIAGSDPVTATSRSRASTVVPAASARVDRAAGAGAGARSTRAAPIWTAPAAPRTRAPITFGNRITAPGGPGARALAAFLHHLAGARRHAAAAARRAGVLDQRLTAVARPARPGCPSIGGARPGGRVFTRLQRVLAIDAVVAVPVPGSVRRRVGVERLVGLSGRGGASGGRRIGADHRAHDAAGAHARV